MGKLVYGLTTSLDGYVNGPDGDIGWSEPDGETHQFVNDRQSRVGTYLAGRRMFETMRIREDEAWLAGYVLEYAAIWRAADKEVFSTTLEVPHLPRITLHRQLDPDAVQDFEDLDLSRPRCRRPDPRGRPGPCRPRRRSRPLRRAGHPGRRPRVPAGGPAARAHPARRAALRIGTCATPSGAEQKARGREP